MILREKYSKLKGSGKVAQSLIAESGKYALIELRGERGDFDEYVRESKELRDAPLMDAIFPSAEEMVFEILALRDRVEELEKKVQ